MSRYVKKSYVDAFQWTGGPDQEEDPEWICDAIREGRVWFSPNRDPPTLFIKISEGSLETYTANAGDYVIRRDMGEIYACPPRVFEATHEKVAFTKKGIEKKGEKP